MPVADCLDGCGSVRTWIDDAAKNAHFQFTAKALAWIYAREERDGGRREARQTWPA